VPELSAADARLVDERYEAWLALTEREKAAPEGLTESERSQLEELHWWLFDNH
jgi:hypothetical protein